MEITLTTGEKIALHRKRLGLTQFQLGERVHETQSSVSCVETGSVKVDVDRLKQYAIALQIDVRELL